MSVLWVDLCCISLLILIQNLLFLSLYFSLYFLAFLFLLLHIFSRQMLHALLGILPLPLLLYPFLFLCLLHVPILLLDLLRRPNPCILDNLLAPFLLLPLALHIPALNIDLGMDGRMVID